MCNFKIKNIIIAMVFVLVLSGSTCALAATWSTAKKTWSYVSKDGIGYTSYQTKDKVGNVYCYPKGGDPYVYVTVGKKNSDGSGKKACSKKVTLTRGKEYTIINSAIKDNYVRLRFDTHTYTGAINSGVWSPDAVKDYTIVGN